MALTTEENSVFIKRPDLLKYFENIEDSKKYAPNSSSKAKTICPDCGYHKESIINNLASKGFTCPRCGDGFSYPNKFGFGFLEQLNIFFISEYFSEWTKGRRYDFYFKLEDKEYVIEMDGNWHFCDNTMSGMTKEEVHAIDVEKNKLAADNNVHMIRINSRESSIEHIKKYILRSDLNKLFDLSNIDWYKCSEYASRSILKTICDLWNNSYDVKQIYEKMGINKQTIRNYLHRGEEIGLCDYKPSTLRKVICLDTKEIFDNGREAAKKFGISFVANITASCNGKANSAGKDPKSGKPYHWMFYDEYLKLSEEEINNRIMFKPKTSNNSGVICLETLEIFKKIDQASKIYNISGGNITYNAQGKTKSAGKLPDGTPLHWMYYDEYLEKHPTQKTLQNRTTYIEKFTKPNNQKYNLIIPSFCLI